MVRTSQSWQRPSSSRAERILGPYPAAGMGRGFHRLIEPFHALASGDHHGNRQIQRVVQALDGCYRSALEEVSVPIDFMPSTAIPCSTSLGITCWTKQIGRAHV